DDIAAADDLRRDGAVAVRELVVAACPLEEQEDGDVDGDQRQRDPGDPLPRLVLIEEREHRSGWPAFVPREGAVGGSPGRDVAQRARYERKCRARNTRDPGHRSPAPR